MAKKNARFPVALQSKSTQTLSFTTTNTQLSTVTTATSSDNFLGMVEIREVCFRLHSTAVTDLNGSPPAGEIGTVDPMQAMSVRIRCGNKDLTNGFAHIRTFCTPQNANIELGGYQQELILNKSYSTTCARWIPPHPILMSKNTVLEFQFQYSLPFLWQVSQFTAYAPFSMDVCAYGQTYDAAISKRTVLYPYIADSQDDSALFNVNYQPANITNFRFRNPFQVPITWQRLLLDLYATNASIAIPAERTSMSSIDCFGNAIQLRMLDGNGDQVVGDYIAADMIVDSRRKSWTYKYCMGPNQHMSFQVQRNQLAQFADQTNFLLNPRICLIGSYESEIQ